MRGSNVKKPRYIVGLFEVVCKSSTTVTGNKLNWLLERYFILIGRLEDRRQILRFNVREEAQFEFRLEV